jgi:predicted nuclease of predicted toxin-antitoxin system
MRVLLDECVPHTLKQNIKGHDVSTVQDAGWAGKRNGELLQLAAGRFDVLLTVDRGFLSQQNLTGTALAVLMLSARSNRLKDLRPLMAEALAQFSTIRPGQVVRVGV